MGIVQELRRRRVFRTAGIYIVAAWATLQVCDLAFSSFGIAPEALRYVWITALAGFPLALVFGWRYDVTADGLKRTPAGEAGTVGDIRLRAPDYAILLMLATIGALFIGNTVIEIRDGSLRNAGPWYRSAGLANAVAVLPLENLSGDDAQAYLVAGLHDALIGTLSRISRLRVTSRYSTRELESGLSLRDVGNVLGVDKVLSGSVLREGNLVRVNVTLADAATEEALWSESYTREFDGLISMQNEVASAVAREVKVQLTPEEARSLMEKADGPSSATYEAYLRGMFQLRKGSPHGYRRAIEIFTDAVEGHPTSALAYAGLAIGYAQLGHSPFPTPGAYPRAREAATRAIEFDPNLAEAHLAVGMYKIYYEWDFSGGEAAFLRALELNPSLVDAHYHYAWLLELWPREAESLKFGEYTKELNPLSPFYASWLAEQYRDAGMYEKAIEEAQTVLALNPRYPVAWLSLGLTYLELGRIDDAIEAHENLRGNRFWGYVLAATLAAAQRDADAEDVRAFIDNGNNNAFTLAQIYAGLGQSDEAIRWLTVARDKKIPWYPWLVAWFPAFAGMNDDPRIEAMATELALEPPEM